MKKDFRLSSFLLVVLIIPAFCQASVTILTHSHPNHTITSGSDEQVYGTAAANQVTLESGAKAELLNFPGSNAITIQSNANLFTVSRSGTTVTFQGSDGTILKIPAASDAQTVAFTGEESRILQIHNGQMMLDDQVVTTTAAAIDCGQEDPSPGCSSLDAAAVIQSLQNLRSTIVGQVDPAIKAQIEAAAAGYPSELADDSAGITQSLDEGDGNVNLNYQIQRRDWLYAAYGTEYTLMGAFGEGQAHLLDTGLWSFLQAAILHPEEAEHIANVMFHLNAKGMFQEALQLGKYAVDNLDAYAGIHNNIAYGKAALGDYLGAVSSSGQALAYAPSNQLFLTGLLHT
jgi:hypothetical protein